RELQKTLERLLHGVAHEDQGVDAARLRLVDSVLENARDLRLAADAAHLAHGRVQVLRPREPAARLAFAEAAIEHELHVETAEARRRLEHLALQAAGMV